MYAVGGCLFLILLIPSIESPTFNFCFVLSNFMFSVGFDVWKVFRLLIFYCLLLNSQNIIQKLGPMQFPSTFAYMWQIFISIYCITFVVSSC